MQIDWGVADAIFRTGWIAVFLLGFFIAAIVPDEKQSAWGVLGGILVVLSGVWFISVVAYGGYLGVRESALGTALDYYRSTWLPVFGAAKWGHGAIAAYLGAWTDTLLFLTPFSFVAVAALFGMTIPKPVESPVFFWGGLVFFYFVGWLVWLAFVNPIAIVPLAATVAVMLAFDFKGSMPDRYSTTQLFRGLQRRVQPVKSGEISQNSITIVWLTSIVAAFWWQLKISGQSLVELYSALLSGLLSLIGFAAIIFTFSYERIARSEIRANVSSDIRSIYRVVGLVLGVTAVGLAFHSNDPVAFDLRNSQIDSTIALSILILAFSGTLLSIEATIQLFQSIVNAMAALAPRGKSTAIAFDEMRSSNAFGTESSTATGLSKLKAHIEDRGYAAIPFSQANVAGLARLRNSILLLQRIESEVSVEDGAIFRQFVERGDVLIVAVDSEDYLLKQHIFTNFGITAEPAVFAEGAASEVVIQNVKFADANFLGTFGMTIEKPVTFTAHEGVNLEVMALTEARELEGTAHEPRPIVLGVAEGKGRAIFVGGVSQWQNSNFGSDNSVDAFDAIIQMAERHLQASAAV